MACASATRASAALAAGASRSAATVPLRSGMLAVGRQTSRPRSNGASATPSTSEPPLASALAGSRTGPDGTPNIRTASRVPSAPTEAAIQYPGHENERGSAIGTRPRFRAGEPLAPEDVRIPVGCGSCSTSRPSAPARHAGNAGSEPIIAAQGSPRRWPYRTFSDERLRSQTDGHVHDPVPRLQGLVRRRAGDPRAAARRRAHRGERSRGRRRDQHLLRHERSRLEVASGGRPGGAERTRAST